MASYKYDILLAGGTLIDGSGEPMRELDVGIVDDSITDVGPKLGGKAREVVDAQGMVVSPGFVDIHGHSDYFILVEPGAPNKLLQGVTTEIGGNCGYSAAPVSRELSDERGESLDRNFGLRPWWLAMDEYLGILEKEKLGINFAVMTGHNSIRASVMGGAARKPSASEMATMAGMVDDAMRAGALGMSTGLIYPPGCFADGDELAEMCAPVAAHGGFFATHMRSEGRELLESIAEVIAASEKAGCRLEISHFKTSGPRNWVKIEDAIGMIDSARERGVDVRCDRYPYTASFTGLSAVLPAWAFEGSRDEFRVRLRKPDVRSRLMEEILRDNGDDYIGRVVIAQTFSDGTHDLEGLSVPDAARARNKSVFDFLFDILAEEPSEPTAVYHTMSEANMDRILNLPHATIGSDSSVRSPGGPLGTGKPHPRAYGTFPRLLRLAREKKTMSLETAVRKMTALPAAMVRIGKRGLLRPGWRADVVVFDPDKVSDTATYEAPHSFPVGIEYVIVNGKIGAIAGEQTSTRAGRVLRREKI